MSTLSCQPRSFFSWTFDVSGAPDGPAEVTFNVLTEQGTITLGREEYDVLKLGPGSGTWQLSQGGRVLAQAYKPSAFRRRFEVSATSGSLIVQASSPFGRSFDVLRENGLVGRIGPTGILGRRATIDCDRDVPTIDLLFAFWLAVQMWRRAAKRNSQGGT